MIGRTQSSIERVCRKEALLMGIRETKSTLDRFICFPTENANIMAALRYLEVIGFDSKAVDIAVTVPGSRNL